MELCCPWNPEFSLHGAFSECSLKWTMSLDIFRIEDGLMSALFDRVDRDFVSNHYWRTITCSINSLSVSDCSWRRNSSGGTIDWSRLIDIVHGFSKTKLRTLTFNEILLNRNSFYYCSFDYLLNWNYWSLNKLRIRVQRWSLILYRLNGMSHIFHR